jgi:signal peptidase II
MKYFKYYLISLFVILVDQAIKLWVHESMYLNEEIKILDGFFKLHYVVNPGMAFGVEFGSIYGKLLLTTFRLVAIAAIGWYLFQLITKNSHVGFIICMAMILGGAVGNVIDSVFYGVLLHNAPLDAPTPWFNGQVIDMFFIDITEGRYPSWVPLYAGDYYSIWPIFNLADASIFLGVTFILIFQKRFMLKEEQ